MIAGRTLRARGAPEDRRDGEAHGHLPFVHGYVVQALARLGHFRSALQALAQYGALDGFWEYYFPETGHGGGAEAQMWSAARYLVCGEVLSRGSLGWRRFVPRMRTLLRGIFNPTTT